MFLEIPRPSWSTNSIRIVHTGLRESPPFSHSRHTMALTYRIDVPPSTLQPVVVVTQPVCAPIRAGWPRSRLVAICLPAVIDRDRVDFLSAGRGGRGVEGERFHGRVKVARRNRWCKRRIGILGEFELVLRDKFGEISTVRPSHDFHDSWNSSRVTRSFPILFGCIREPLLSITRSDAYRRKFRNFETNNGSRCREGLRKGIVKKEEI